MNKNLRIDLEEKYQREEWEADKSAHCGRGERLPRPRARLSDEDYAEGEAPRGQQSKYQSFFHINSPDNKCGEVRFKAHYRLVLNYSTFCVVYYFHI